MYVVLLTSYIPYLLSPPACFLKSQPVERIGMHLKKVGLLADIILMMPFSTRRRRTVVLVYPTLGPDHLCLYSTFQAKCFRHFL